MPPSPPDIFEVIVNARTGEIVKEVTLEGYATMAAACYVYPVALGGWYSQNDPSWSSNPLGNSTSYTIGSAGCVVTSLAMTYHNVWGVSTTPAELNTSARSAGCFAAGSADVNIGCAVNSRGGPHYYSSVSMSSVATAICAGYPVMVYVTWGGGHKMLAYYYSGGSTSSMSSYRVVDPWTGTSKSLSGYTATRWLKLY
ncbi:MAG: C39 family peptidase [Candidatus Uhrbacteria bacterium]